MPATSDLLINGFHLTVFAIANAIFVFAVYQRLKLVSKGKPANKLADWGTRIRSFLLNVIFQHKLFKHPLRGMMHALIFYGFISYLVHTTSQMIAGNAWAIFKMVDIDPYTFWITDFTWLGFSFSGVTTALIIAGLVTAIGLTFVLMHNTQLGKRINWRTNGDLQWFFLILLLLEFGTIFTLMIGSGTPIYEGIVQHFSLLVLLGCGYFAYRRWIRHAKGLDIPSAQSAIVLGLISTLMLSTLIGGAAQTMLDGGSHAIWINRMVLAILGPMGLNDSFTAEATRNFAWWVHIGTVYTFMVFVPMSKHSHLLFAPINYLLVQERPAGQIRNIDLEAEDAVWGAGNVSELPWASTLDGLSCIECGRCTVECPANRTGKPLDPKKIMVDVKHSMLAHWDNLMQSDGSEAAASPVVGNPYITEEELWSCTSCHACVEACPVGNNQLDAIYEMRRHLVLTESRFPQELQLAFQNMENNSNPWGIGAHTRADWCADLGVKTMAEDSSVDVLYWVGCAGSFDDRNKRIARSFVKIMQQAGVKFSILGTEENCTGDSARRGGNEYLYQTLAQTNIETLNNYNVKKIVTACPHCFNTLKNEYPQMGGNYDVQHHSDFIDDLVRDGKVEMDPAQVDKMKDRRAVFHDSCYLGRYNEVFEQPRDLVRAATGMDLAEASDHHRTSLCCGAGGAQMWMEEKYERVNMKRTEQLLDTGADTIATACPFCITMITDGVKSKSLESDVKVLDVAEIVAASMKGGDGAIGSSGFAVQGAGAHH